MKKPGDKPFGIVAALALISGAAVMIPSLAVLAITLIAVVSHLL
jgi:hypothetical protein